MEARAGGSAPGPSRAGAARRTSLALGLLALLGAGAQLSLTGGAAAGEAGGGAVAALERSPCPAPYDVGFPAATYSAPALTRSRRDRFRIYIYTRRIAPPVNWRQDPEDTGAFQSSLNSLTWMDILFYRYQHGERGALRQARNLALDWIDADRRGQLPSRAWIRKVVGDRAPYLTYLARSASCEGMLGARSARLLLESLARHARFLNPTRNYSTSNHGLFMDLGLTLMGRQAPFLSGATNWVHNGIGRFPGTLYGGLRGTEGFWMENSAHYHQVVAITVDRMLQVPGAYDPRMAAELERMRAVTRWLTMPDGQLVQLGDSYRTTPRPRALGTVPQAFGFLRLWESGLAIVKQPSHYLSLAATHGGPIHKHADELTFDLYDRGRRIISDTGLYHQDRDRYYRFSVSAPAHNVLTVDGENFRRSPSFAYGSGLLAAGTGDGWYAILGRNPSLEQNQDVEHQRLLLYKPGTAVIVADRVLSAEVHTYRRYFHLDPGIGIRDREGYLAIVAPGLHGSIYSETPGARELRKRSRGRKEPLGGWLFRDFRKATPRWSLRYRTRGRNLDHVATIGLGSVPAIQAHLQGRLGDGAARLTLTSNGAPAGTLAVRRDGRTLSVDAGP